MPVRRQPTGTFTPGTLAPHLYQAPKPAPTKLSGQLRGEKRPVPAAPPTTGTR